MDDSLSINRGDTTPLRFTITDVNDDAFNLTDYPTITFLLKRSQQDSDAAAEFTGSLGAGVEIAFTRVDGVVDVTIPATITRNLQYGKPYFWFIVLTHSTGAISTPESGTLFLDLKG